MDYAERMAAYIRVLNGEATPEDLVRLRLGPTARDAPLPDASILFDDRAVLARLEAITRMTPAERWELILTGQSVRPGMSMEQIGHQIRQDTVFTCYEHLRIVAQGQTGAVRDGVLLAIEELEALERDCPGPA